MHTYFSFETKNQWYNSINVQVHVWQSMLCLINTCTCIHTQRLEGSPSPLDLDLTIIHPNPASPHGHSGAYNQPSWTRKMKRKRDPMFLVTCVWGYRGLALLGPSGAAMKTFSESTLNLTQVKYATFISRGEKFTTVVVPLPPSPSLPLSLPPSLSFSLLPLLTSYPQTGYYFTGDGALRDEDNDYRITGRVDDMLNCKGHRIGTAELECAMVRLSLSLPPSLSPFSLTLFLPLSPSMSLCHSPYILFPQNHEPRVAETAVVGYPHEIYGQGNFSIINYSKNYNSLQSYTFPLQVS